MLINTDIKLFWSLFIISKTTSIEVEGDVSDDEDGGEDSDADVDSRLVEGGVRALYQIQIPAWEPAQPDMDIRSSYLSPPLPP